MSDCKYCTWDSWFLTGARLNEQHPISVFMDAPNVLEATIADRKGHEKYTRVLINYCPMCGRRLDGANETDR